MRTLLVMSIEQLRTIDAGVSDTYRDLVPASDQLRRPRPDPSRVQGPAGARTDVRPNVYAGESRDVTIGA
jgi:hypothetical protein